MRRRPRGNAGCCSSIPEAPTPSLAKAVLTRLQVGHDFETLCADLLERSVIPGRDYQPATSERSGSPFSLAGQL